MKTDRTNAAIAERPEGTRMLELRAFAPTQSRRVVQKDGDNGIIYGVSVLTRGEAQGHDLWADMATLGQVAEYGNANGIKCRFAHPGVSSDGLGKLLARPKSFRVEGGKVLADLHFLESASKTPNGDLAAYVMNVVEESPDLIGLSMVCKRDLQAEQDFMDQNTEDKESFKSPEEGNTRNFPHIRLNGLRAVDVVEDAAANPDGFFARGSATAADADELFTYAFGLSAEEPKVSESLGIHPQRAKDFLQNFLARRDLRVVSISRESSVSASTAATDPPVKDRLWLAGNRRSGTSGGTEPPVKDRSAKNAGPVKSRRKLAIGGEDMTALQKVIAQLPEDSQDVCSLAIEQHVESVSKEAVATAVAPLNEELGTLRAQKDNLDQKVQQLEAEVAEHKAITERGRLEASVTAKLSELISSGKYPESAREELKPLVTKMQKEEALSVEEAEKYADLRTPADKLTTLTTSVDEGDVTAVQEEQRAKARASFQRGGHMAGAKGK